MGYIHEVSVRINTSRRREVCQEVFDNRAQEEYEEEDVEALMRSDSLLGVVLLVMLKWVRHWEQCDESIEKGRNNGKHTLKVPEHMRLRAFVVNDQVLRHIDL